jgi:hypothetical protein
VCSVLPCQQSFCHASSVPWTSIARSDAEDSFAFPARLGSFRGVVPKHSPCRRHNLLAVGAGADRYRQGISDSAFCFTSPSTREVTPSTKRGSSSASHRSKSPSADPVDRLWLGGRPACRSRYPLHLHSTESVALPPLQCPETNRQVRVSESIHINPLFAPAQRRKPILCTTVV